MTALYLRLTLAILISLLRHCHRRQKMLIKKRLPNRKMWARPTIADRSTVGAFQLTFLITKKIDRVTLFR